MLKNFREIVNPPYKIKDIPILLGLVVLILSIPVITFSISKTREPSSKAAITSRALPCQSYGDVNLNGYIDEKDIQQIYTHAAGTTTLNSSVLKIADVNLDGSVTNDDFQAIRSYLFGTAPTVPVCADSDGDGFSNALEKYLGTSIWDACTNVGSGTDSWPADVNRNGKFDTLDLGGFVNGLKKDVKTYPNLKRIDFNADGLITQADITIIQQKLSVNTPCANTVRTVGQTLRAIDNNRSPAAVATSNISIYGGEGLTLEWGISGAPGVCEGSSNLGGLLPNTGSKIVKPTVPGSYIIYCSDGQNQKTKEISVTLLNPCSPDGTNPSLLKNYRIYQATGDPGVYVTQNCQKRLVASPEVMEYCHYRWPAVGDVGGVQVNKYLPGLTRNPEDIRLGRTCPTVSSEFRMNCTGNTAISPSKTSGIQPGEEFSVTGTGLTDCTSYDSLQLQYIENGAWKDFAGKLCKFTGQNRSGCTITGVSFGEGSFTLRLAKDINNDGTKNSYSTSVNIEVKTPTPAGVSGALPGFNDYWFTIPRVVNIPARMPLAIALTEGHGGISNAYGSSCTGGCQGIFQISGSRFNSLQQRVSNGVGRTVYLGDMMGSYDVQIWFGSYAIVDHSGGHYSDPSDNVPQGESWNETQVKTVAACYNAGVGSSLCSSKTGYRFYDSYGNLIYSYAQAAWDHYNGRCSPLGGWGCPF